MVYGTFLPTYVLSHYFIISFCLIKIFELKKSMLLIIVGKEFSRSIVMHRYIIINLLSTTFKHHAALNE